jgi:hypothetical protein
MGILPGSFPPFELRIRLMSIGIPHHLSSNHFVSPHRIHGFTQFATGLCFWSALRPFAFFAANFAFRIPGQAKPFACLASFAVNALEPFVPSVAFCKKILCLFSGYSVFSIILFPMILSAHSLYFASFAVNMLQGATPEGAK